MLLNDSKYCGLLRNLLPMVGMMLGFCSFHSFADCKSASSGLDFSVDKMYISNGSESFAELFSTEDVHRMVEQILTFTCDNSPIYIRIKGDTTSYFRFEDEVFKYSSVEESISSAALMNKLKVSILEKGQAPGANAFTIFISDKETQTAWDSANVEVLQVRAQEVVTDWSSAVCSVSAPGTVHFPKAAPGDTVQAQLDININCDKDPNTFMSGIFLPAEVTTKTSDGVIYNKDDITITMKDKNDEASKLNQLEMITLDSNHSATLSYTLTSEVGPHASSGDYGTVLTYTVYHN
ncbi:hypothetical protein [Enterobacter hormaechei]